MNRQQFVFTVCIVITLLSAALGMSPAPALASVPSSSESGAAGASQDGGGPVVVRLYYGDRATLDAFAAQYDIWEVNQAQGYAVIMLSLAEYQTLANEGYRIELDARKMAELQLPASIPGYACYRTVEETYTAIQNLAANYPTLVDIQDIGDSWDKVTGGGPAGYDIYALRITNKNIPGPKPTFFLMAEIHAREYVTAEAAARLAELILQNYGADPTITFFVDYHNIYIVPMANPDGRKWAEQGYSWRKNTDNDDGCTTFPNYGTDLNRNYAFHWGGAGTSPCGETYQGPSAASEPETQAIQNYVLSLFPDQRGPGDTDPAPNDATGILITLHSYSQLVLWPWGWTSTDAPNAAQLQTLGVKLATFNGYTPQQSSDLYGTTGTTDDWSYGVLGIASYTFEMGTTFFQDCGSFESTIWPDNRDALLYAWKIAETPYMTAYGPDALSAAVTPLVVTPGQAAQLTATVNDAQNGNQQVAAAEYYVLPLHGATPPGDPGTGAAMNPADGSWNNAVENVVATVDTTSLSAGAYLLAARGKDAGNNWGPFTAAFLYVVEPGMAPVIEGYVRDASNNLPLAATVTAGAFQAASDPATGYYSMTVISGTYNMTASASGYATSSASGIVAQDYQTTRQDFFLSPFCNIFADDVEAGNQGWTAQSPWAITTSSYHSYNHAWTDSPAGNYGNNVNVALTSPAFNLSGYEGVQLSFWHKYDLEPDYDYGYVEYSTNGGGSWTTAASYDGYNVPWAQATLSLPALNNQSNVKIRFRLKSDGYITADGWYVDDVLLVGGGPACIPPLAPTAEFSSDSPATLCEPVRFVNQTVGSTPLTYVWDFGDGAGASTQSDPVYTYAWPGVYTVTMTATNSAGSDSVSRQVVVEPGLSFTRVTIAGETNGYPGVYTFTASYEPVSATLPINYLWDDGGAAAQSVRELGVGTHTLTVTAVNCGSVVTDTHVITIECAPVDILDVTSDSPVVLGDAMRFAAVVSGTAPMTYTWDFGGAGVADLTDPANPTFVYDAPGVYTVTLMVENGCGLDTFELAVEALAPPCVALTDITISGPSLAGPGTYTFTTSYNPPNADPPIVYLWDDSGTMDYSVRTFAVTGTYTLAVEAPNCGGAAVVTDEHVIEIVAVGQFNVYVPLYTGSVFAIAVAPIVITNTSGMTETYDLTVVTDTWKARLAAPAVTLEPGASVVVTLTVEFPADAGPGESGTLEFRVTPQAGGAPFTATLTANTACRFDFDGNALVDITDVVRLLIELGGSNPYFDMNHDGSVDVTDMVVVLGRFGAGCP